MLLSRIGLAALKGTRHLPRDAVELARSGPVGDRVFCLVDPVRGQVLRTVENPALVLVESDWDDEVLTVRLPSGELVSEPPRPTGERLVCDYWGRDAELEALDSGHAAALSAHLDRDVVLVRVNRPGEVVYGGSVSLVTTSAVAELGRRVRDEALDVSRFRATFALDDAESPLDERDLAGRVLRLGTAVLRVRAPIPRCAVIDIGPSTGRKDRNLLATLAGYRRGAGEIWFGIDAEVLVPGRAGAGDTVSMTAPDRVAD